jgi:hypothetical protein
MLDRLLARLKPHATSRNILILLALFLVFEVAVFPVAGARISAVSGGQGPLDLNLFNPPAQSLEAVAAYGPDGRTTYVIVELTADLLFPIVYALFLSLTLIFLLSRGFPAENGVQRLAALPLFAALCDYLENLGILLMLITYPRTFAPAAWLPALFTPLKWLMFIFSVVVIVIALIAVLRRRRAAGPQSA